MKKLIFYCLIFFAILLVIPIGLNKYCGSDRQIDKLVASIKTLNKFYDENGFFPSSFDANSVCIHYDLADVATEAFLWLRFPMSGDELGFKLPKTVEIIGNDSASLGFHNYIYDEISHRELQSLFKRKKEKRGDYVPK